MADLYFSEVIDGFVGYLPDMPITADFGLGLGMVADIIGYAGVSADFGLGLGMVADIIEHDNGIDFGLGLGMVADMVQECAISADFGLGLGMVADLTAPLPITADFGLGLGMVADMVQHGMTADFGLGLGMVADMVQPGVFTADLVLDSAWLCRSQPGERACFLLIALRGGHEYCGSICGRRNRQ